MNQKNTYTTPTVLLVGSISSVIIAFLAGVLYCIAYHNSYETDIRHFEAGAALPYIFGVLMLLSAVIFTVSSVLLRKKYTLADSVPGSAETFALWFCGLMFLIFGFISFSGAHTEGSSQLGALCTGALAPLAVVSAVPFFLRTSEKTRNTALHAVFSIVPVLWGICLLFKYYFDLKEMPLNDPELTLTMVSISCAVIFFLCECRISMGIATPAIAAFSSSAALCLTGSISAARLVLWRLDGHVLPEPAETLLLFAVAVLAACRLLELSSSMAPVTKPETEEAPVGEAVADTASEPFEA